MRRCLMIDLKDEPEAIARYDEHHRAVWPEVIAHLRDQGVLCMEIYRLGVRLVMWLETDDRVFDASRKAQREAGDPRLAQWQALMATLQAPTPWTPAGQSWTEATQVFDLSACPAP